MNVDLLNNKIIIIKDSMKNSLLRLISESKKLVNVKIITLSELKKKYYFDYDKETIFYVCNKYKVNNEIAKTYIDNLYYLKDIDEDKIQFLYELKNDLDSHSLLKYNSLFKSFLNDKEIILYDLKYVAKFYLNIFSKLKETNNITEIYNEEDNGLKDLYGFNSIEEEISFVASSICELIKSGIDINHIKISNINSSNAIIVKKVFKMFNIPILLPSFNSVKGTRIVKVFKDNYNSNINETLDIVHNYVKSDNDLELYNKIIGIVNSYYFIEDYNEVKDLIFSDIDNLKTYSINYTNAVREIDIEGEIVDSNDHVFLINYNEGVFPINNKDEDYLNDHIKSLLGISTSYELNSNNNKHIYNVIKRINNLVVTYSKYDSLTELYISSSYDKDLFNEKEPVINYSNSNIFNINKLVSLMDEYKKYGSSSEELFLLNNHYKNLNYLGYSNKYNGIPKELLLKKLNNSLTLSYSSLENYYECGFKYYLSNVLYLNKFEDTFDITIGNIFHHILSKCFISDIDFDKLWDYEINHCKYEFNNMEKFFLIKLKSELLLIIETIKNQLKYTQLNKIMCEKEIIIDVNKDLHIKFKGYVDKILYDEFGDESIAVVIDYKTGNPNTNINNSIYGLDMQLPIYMYLIKNSNIIKNVRIGGLYLQKILNNSKTLEDKINDLKLQGYSNSDICVLEKVDSSYMDSNVIKSMKVSNNGFYAYSKVLSDSEFDYLSKLVSTKIKECANNIMDSKFDIDPKEIKGINKSCKYCKYKDICYMKNEDIIELKEVEDMFGGDE